MPRALGLIVFAFVACGPGNRSPGTGGGDDASVGDASFLDAPVVGVSCSSDLHDVLDGQGNVIKVCPADAGCEAGVCVPACTAAAASQGSVGCDFVVATPSFYPIDGPPCFAVFIANNWPANGVIAIARDGISYDAAVIGRVPDGTPNAAGWPSVPATGVASSSVAVLFLSTDPASANSANNMVTPLICPIAPAISATGGSAVSSGTSSAQTGVGHAWHITTSVPISAYDILPYGGASSFLPSAELLLPTTAWGTNYVAVTPIPFNGSTQNGPGWGQVVASQDGTTVQISPTVDLPSGAGVIAAPANQMTTYQLNAGDYIQWQDSGDMSGSILSSTKPVSFTGGSGYLCATSATSILGGCDSAHQEIPPVSALGFEYVAPPYATRRADLMEESIRYRLVGAVAGTQLTFDPPISGAPATIGAGQVAEVETIGPFTIKSQDAMHPFYVAQYMSGCVVTSGSRPGGGVEGCLGDEEFVNILPPAQWLASYVFFTDPSYKTTNLVVVRKKTPTGFKDVTVDCIGTLTGWQPVAAGAEYEITNVDLERSTPVGSCVNGRHTATSEAAFNVMVWGLDYAASYAYPAGGNVGTINPVIVIP